MEQEPQITVAIPLYNEKEGIQKVLPELLEKARQHNLQILVVDDGSTDGSPDFIIKNERIKLICHPRNMGYGASIKTAVKNSTTPWVLTFDSDGQHNPEDISRIISLINHFDMIIGSRKNIISKSKMYRTGRLLLSLLVSYACGKKIPDFNSGMRLFRVRDFQKFIKFYPDGYSISTTLTLIFHNAGLKVEFLPIETLPRKGGPTKVSFFLDGISTLLLILKLTTLLCPEKIFIPIAATLIFTGLIYSLISQLINSKIPYQGIAVLVAGFIMIAGVKLFKYFTDKFLKN